MNVLITVVPIFKINTEKKGVKYLQGISFFLELTVVKKTKTKNLCSATPDLVIPLS
jgi:hypothetical protein